MDKRYKQANREALISLLLTFLYLIAWFISAYSVGNELGILGFPLWFEISCIFMPIGFIIVCWAVVKYQFKSIPLD